MNDTNAKRVFGCALVGWLVGVLLTLGFWAAVAYIVMHFVLKFW